MTTSSDNGASPFPSADTSPRLLGSGTRNFSGSRSSAALSFSIPRARDELIQRPSGVMPIGTTSYFSLSRAFMTAVAETRDTSCSPERPPKMIPTRIFRVMR